MASEPPPLDDLDVAPEPEQGEETKPETSPFGDPEPAPEEDTPALPVGQEEEEEEAVQCKPDPEPSPPPMQSVPLQEQEDVPTLEPRAADEPEELAVKQKAGATAPREPAKPVTKSLDLFDEDGAEGTHAEEHLHYEVRACRHVALTPSHSHPHTVTLSTVTLASYSHHLTGTGR